MCSVVPESTFQFASPELAYFEFVPNKDFNAQNGKDVNLQIKMGVSVKKNNLSPEATVDLTVKIGDKGGNSPFYILAVERADFRWEKELDDAMVKNLLDQNAPSLLLSYLRPIIVQITEASAYNVCNIPFVNFANFKEARKDTREE